MAQEIQAKLPDGRILTFPAGTKDEVIDAAVQSELNLDKKISDVTKPPSEVGKDLIPEVIKKNLVLDPVTLGSMAAGTAAGVLTKSPTIGSATGSAVDRFLRQMTGENDKSLGENALGVGADVAIDAVGGAVLRAPFRGAKLIKDGLAEKYGKTIFDKEFLKLKPTGAQLLESVNSPKAKIVNAFENLLSPAGKRRALQRSFEAAKDEGDKYVDNLTGRKVNLDQPNALANIIKEGEELNFNLLKMESTAHGEAVKAISKLNAVSVGGKTVEGPILYVKTIKEVQTMLADIKSSNLHPDSDKKIVEALNDILKGANVRTDKVTGAMDFDPVPFESAWKDKQIAGNFGYGSPMSQTDIKDVRFRRIQHAIDDDIEDSIKRDWAVDSPKAAETYAYSKALVNKRQTLFAPTNERGKSIDTLIDSVSKPTETLNAIMDDPEKLKRFLVTSSIAVPAGGSTSKVTPIKYISNNARQDAKGYQMMRMLNEATVPSPLDATKNHFDPNKLMGILNDPNRQETLKILYGSTGLSNVKKFYNNIAMTTQKGSTEGFSRSVGLRVGTYGVTFGVGITSAMMTGAFSLPTIGSAIGITAIAGAHGLAKALTNPESARVLIAMSQGGPLGMSTKLASRIIMSGLRNQPITIQYEDGNSVDAKVNNIGKIVIPLGTEIR